MSNADVYKRSILDKIKRISTIAAGFGRAMPLIVEKAIPKTDIVGWLAGSHEQEKRYWKARDGLTEIGGVGVAISLTDNRSGSAMNQAHALIHSLSDDNPIFFGGRRFAKKYKSDETWMKYPDDNLVIPRQMIIRRKEQYYRAVCLKISDGADAERLAVEANRLLNKADFAQPPSFNGRLPIPIEIRHDPDIDGWHSNMEQALDVIASGEIEKVVLARRTDYLFDETIDPLMILMLLMRQNSACFSFLHQTIPGNAFISMTPERLYWRQNRNIEVAALSSTLPRGTTTEEDKQLERKLLGDPKLRREHQVVIEGILESLATLSSRPPGTGKTEIMKLQKIQHLQTSIKAVLKDGIDDGAIVAALHPTPAVGGQPRDKAMELIGKLERFDRGYYAAPVGYIAADMAEFAVAIRSLLVRGRIISVFTGAGIVEGSEPEMEWREVESKDILRPILCREEAP